MAELWITAHQAQQEAGSLAVFAIVLRDGMKLVGAIGLTIDRSADKGDLGYWIGKPFWGQGFCTEYEDLVLCGILRQEWSAGPGA